MELYRFMCSVCVYMSDCECECVGVRSIELKQSKRREQLLPDSINRVWGEGSEHRGGR